jgi:hypothetical protein
VVVGAYHHSPVVRIAVKGVIVTLPKEKAVADSFGGTTLVPFPFPGILVSIKHRAARFEAPLRMR